MGTAIIDAKPNDVATITIVPRAIPVVCYDGKRHAAITIADIWTVAA